MRLIRCQTLCEDRIVASSNPRVSVSQITTLPLAFADDVRAYADAGLDGIGTRVGTVQRFSRAYRRYRSDSDRVGRVYQGDLVRELLYHVRLR